MRFHSLLAALLIAAACGPSADPPPDLTEVLRQEEEKLLAQRPAAWSAEQAFGADPFRIDYLPGIDRYLVLLRNASEVLLCDGRLKVLDRRPVPRSPAGWARQGEERLFVAGELSSQVSVLGLEGDRLRPLETIELRQTVSVRDLVFVPGPQPALYLLDGFDRQLVRLDLSDGGERTYPLGAGPTQVLHQDRHLIINLLHQHAILVLPLVDGFPDFELASRIPNDGPFWGLAARRIGQLLLIAAGGIENRPLDRSGGEFGNVDSFLYLFQLRCPHCPQPDSPPSNSPPSNSPQSNSFRSRTGLTTHQGVFRWQDQEDRAVSLNLSEHQVVTPKALAFHAGSQGGLELWTAGYGSPRIVVFRVTEVNPSGPVSSGTGADLPGHSRLLVKAGQSVPALHNAGQADALSEQRVKDLELLRLEEAAPGISDLNLHWREGELLLALANPLLDRVETKSVRRSQVSIDHQASHAGAADSAPTAQGTTDAGTGDPGMSAPGMTDPSMTDPGVGDSTPTVLKLEGGRQASASSRLGEALFFTTLLSPNNSSRGSLSRLTCEACHFEGHIDGRVHFTGREDIHLSTKTLRGMADNLPLFSRGGDQSLASMVMAEFRVANQGDEDVFRLSPSHHPWLEGLAGFPQPAQGGVLTPEDLRKAFLAFFVDFRHRPNPWALRRNSTGSAPSVRSSAGFASLDPLAQSGLKVFRQRCEDCHQAIESTRLEGQAVPLDQWPEWLLDEDRGLIWGAPFFTKTGLRPYVDQAGTRVPSLRRIWLKYPYFTDGSSPTIEDVLGRFRYCGTTVWHHYDASLDSPPEAPLSALTSQEIEALQALLRYF